MSGQTQGLRPAPDAPHALDQLGTAAVIQRPGVEQHWIYGIPQHRRVRAGQARGTRSMRGMPANLLRTIEVVARYNLTEARYVLLEGRL